LQVPLLRPFPEPCSVVVIDNAAIHHDPRVEAAIHSVGALVKYLPAYSPDLMPSEFVFSQIKAKLRNFGPHSTLVRACFCCAGVIPRRVCAPDTHLPGARGAH
jgi:transposase